MDKDATKPRNSAWTSGGRNVNMGGLGTGVKAHAKLKLVREDVPGRIHSTPN